MTRTHMSEQEICIYVEALKLQRTGGLQVDVVNHVSECMECKKQIMQLYDVLRNEDYREAGSHPLFGPLKQTRPKGISLVYRLVAALVLLLGAGLTAYYAFVKRPAEAPSSTQTAIIDTSALARDQESRTISPPPEDYAAYFTPSPTLEDLVGAEFRSASVTVESPANGEVVKDDIIFRWSSNDKGKFRMRILTNQEEEVFEAMTEGTMVRCKKQLEPGLYYWTLQADGDLVHVGKFTVNLP